MKTCNVCRVSKPPEEFHKRGNSLKHACKDCRRVQRGSYYEKNRNKYRMSEGYCVYKAVYPEGNYIGRGIVRTRRNDHMSGNAYVSKLLGSKAIEFNVLVKGSREYCEMVESKLIDSIGLDNLLNRQRGTLKRYD